MSHVLVKCSCLLWLEALPQGPTAYRYCTVVVIPSHTTIPSRLRLLPSSLVISTYFVSLPSPAPIARQHTKNYALVLVVGAQRSSPEGLFGFVFALVYHIYTVPTWICINEIS